MIFNTLRGRAAREAESADAIRLNDLSGITIADITPAVDELSDDQLRLVAGGMKPRDPSTSSKSCRADGPCWPDEDF